ncbi:TolC family protein [Glaciecola sp. SC05]|uniref:TolC family protein n=1 Tax=Glaciecola sp. SC05 TaxID=1987355 RepID=UPI003529A6FD
MTCFKHTALAISLAFVLIISVASHAKGEDTNSHLLTLERAISLAIHNDPWLQKSEFQERAALARSVALSSMPDPVMSVGIANLPTDGYDFNQEPMTQLKAGISQMFPRGDTLRFQRQQQLEMSQQQPFMRQNRQANVAVTAALLWLDAYRAKASMRLIENDRALFEQLGDIAETNYASGLGNTRQQDLLQAELELVRIEDRLLMLSAQEAQAIEKLSEWIAIEEGVKRDDAAKYSGSHKLGSAQVFELPEALPDLVPNSLALMLQQHANFNANVNPHDFQGLSRLIVSGDQQQLAEMLTMHPMIQSIQQKISAGQTGIELAKQKYKPQWGVNASYAYRDDDPMDRSRADFLSVGFSVDLPLFTENRQDQELSSAVNEAEAIKTEKRLTIRNMMSSLRAVYASYQRLLARQNLYEERFITQTQQQAEATLTAYTNDEGDFAEVARARIAVLNAQLDALNIEVELLKTKMQMGYFFVQAQSIQSSRQDALQESSVQSTSGAQ